MPDLLIPSDDLAELIVRVRGVQAKEGLVDPGSGSNPTDDCAIDALQESGGDLSRREVIDAIGGFDERQQAELVALLWIGRGDAEPEEWEQTVEMARERRDTPTASYLIRQPLVAEHWSEGLERLGIGTSLGADDEL